MVGTKTDLAHREFPLDEEEFPLEGQFGQRLMQARLAAGFKSPRSLSVKIGVSDGTVMSYEKGEQEPKLSVLSRLAGACSVSIDWLARGEGQMQYPRLGEQSDDTFIVQGASMDIYKGGLLQDDPTSAAPATPSLQDIVDFDRMALAIEITEEVINQNNQEVSSAQRAERYAATYDALAKTDPTTLRIALGINSSIPERARQAKS